MAYSNDMYSKAERVLEKRRDKAENDAEIRAEKIKAQLPEISDIQDKLGRVGLEISQLFLYKGDRAAKIEELHQRSDALVSKRNAILVSNGYDADVLKPRYTCSVCEDRGYVNGRRCKCFYDVLKELMREEVKRFAPLDDCTFDNFSLDYYSDRPDEDGIVPKQRAKKIFEASEKFAQNFSKNSKNLMFLGSTGLGKTHLSLAVANVVINRGFSVCYGTSHNICEDLRSEMFGRDENLNYTTQKINNSDLLIIDDLGTEVDNQYNIATIYNIINTRLLSKSPTIISTNYELDELLEKYDQRITSRLTGEYTQLYLIGKDIRNLK